jgi:alkaline phosphatase D
VLRRKFIRVLAGSTIFSWAGFRASKASAATARFDHGVASGDPLSDRVILWTRVSNFNDEPAIVNWKIASDSGMNSVVNQGTYVTGPESDYTVKVDADKLPSGRILWFQFEIDGVLSPVGRTKTAATGSLEAARFAVVSCANHPYGYFHAYREIANRDDLDAVIHLGDYIYEYGMGGYATEKAEELDRIPEPSTEAISLSDFRRRHAQYKADADSIAMHGQHPLIAIWDDHEIGNDSWRGGAENHQDDEGTWANRRDSAIQAYLEWMPIRAAHYSEDTKIFRRFEYGDLLSLLMLDTRIYGRDRQPDVGDDVTVESVTAAMGNPERRVLGRRQEGWLRRNLQASEGFTWQIIGQQILVSPVRTPDLEPLLDLDGESMLSIEQLKQYIGLSKSNPPMLLDTWDGYPSARQDFLKDLYEYATNPVVLSGDLHTPLAGNLIPWGHQNPVAVEFMTGSVTSPGFAEYFPERERGGIREATLELNPSLSYLETEWRGWMCLSVTRETCTAEWHLLDTVHSESYRSEMMKRLAVRAGYISDGIYEV